VVLNVILALSGVRNETFSNMFCIRGEGSAYFNIRGKGNVIQASFKGEECNLHINK